MRILDKNSSLIFTLSLQKSSILQNILIILSLLMFILNKKSKYAVFNCYISYPIFALL